MTPTREQLKQMGMVVDSYRIEIRCPGERWTHRSRGETKATSHFNKRKTEKWVAYLRRGSENEYRIVPLYWKEM